MEIWCKHQMVDETGILCCLAHLHEDRVLRCPYESNEDRLKSDYPCADCKCISEFDFNEAVDYITKRIALAAQVPEKFLRGDGL